MIGEFAICGMAFDELNGIETTSPIVTCHECVDRIRVIRFIHTRRRTQDAPDLKRASAKSDTESTPAVLGSLTQAQCKDCHSWLFPQEILSHKCHTTKAASKSQPRVKKSKVTKPAKSG